ASPVQGRGLGVTRGRGFAARQRLRGLTSGVVGQLAGDLRLVLPAVAEPVGALGAGLDLLADPARVAVLVLAPHLPLAGVVAELGLVDHRDAVRLGADRLADPAAAARLHVRVVHAVRHDVEAGVGALQPAQRALDALREVDDRPHGPRRVLLERGVAGGPEAAHLAGRGVGHGRAHRDARDGD